MSTPRTLQRGMVGPDVEALQKFFGIKADGFFGEETQKFARMWQSQHGLKPDGVWGPLSRAAAAVITTRPPPIPPFDGKPAAFIQARYFGPHRFGVPISLVCIHTAETTEGTKTARNVGNWFASEMLVPKLQHDGAFKLEPTKASTHYGVDSLEIIQYVNDSAMAYGAGIVNRRAIHIEHAGRASQTPEQWRDPYSEMMLKRSAALVASKCRLYNIPIKRLTVDDLKANGSGICGHDTVTHAYAVKGGHEDPGVSFPWSRYIDLVMQADGMGSKPHVS